MAMRLNLIPHPDTPSDALTGIEVEVARTHARQGSRRISLRFVATGNVRAIRLPPPSRSPERKDDLWQHTCFETFVRIGEDAAYREFNFAPSGDWACYRFDSYRNGMEPDRQAQVMRIDGEVRLDPMASDRREHLLEAGIDPFDRFAPPFYMLTASLDMERTHEAVDQPWHLGLSAIIEERNGSISYWALKHPEGKPDFHQPDCFALELAPARPA